MKKLMSVMLASSMLVSLAACGGSAPSSSAASSEATSTPASSAATTPASSDAAATPATDGAKPYISIVSKGFQHQFWQVVKKGAEQAATDLGVEISFDGPPTESDIAVQVDMLKASMDKKPAAICLAALDTESVLEQLNTCKTNGVPVVGFDSGVPNAPEGSIYATASTDNAAAAAIAAENLFNNADFAAKLKTATVEAPITVGVLSQDATSDSIIKRTSGFVDKLVELIGEGDVDVVGHDNYAKKSTNGAKVIISVNVPASTSAENMKSGAELLLTSSTNLAAIYGSNENAAGGILAASNSGADFDKTSGKFKDIIALGFDAGETQRTAVEKGWFIGSVTQDPYQIGYKAVSLAVDALNGKAVASPIIDTGAKWYDAEALKDPSISELVYK